MNEGYLASQYTMIVELLEKIYADEIKIKGKVKMLSEQIACGRLLLSTEASHNEDTTPSVTPQRGESQGSKTDAQMREYATLQSSAQRLLQSMEKMRENRDAFVDVSSLLEKRLEKLEILVTITCEHVEMTHNRSRSASFSSTMPVTKREKDKAEHLTME
ncbi:hypothetical protein WA577_006723 [Blastocystis sp. JDR]